MNSDLDPADKQINERVAMKLIGQNVYISPYAENYEKLRCR